MKKFYSVIALAAAVALSASAEGRYQASSLQVPTPKLISAGKSMPLTASPKATVKSVNPADYATTYTWSCTTLLSGEGYDGSSVVVELTNAATGEASITLASSFKLKGTFDAEAGTLTIPTMQFVGTDEYGDNYFYLKDVNSQGQVQSGAGTATSTVGVLSNGTITFPSLDVWACGDPENEDFGWYFMTYNNKFGAEAEEPEPGDELTFKLYGKGVLSGDWFVSTLTGEDPTESYEVDVYVAEEDPDVLVVRDGLKPMYAAMGSGDEESPALTFYTYDPSNVILELVGSGFGNQTHGQFLCMNDGYYGLATNTAPDVYSTITKGEGTTIITCPAKSLLILTQTSQKLYYGNSTTDAVLTISTDANSIENVAAESDSNAPVEYFNLQGQRIAAPVAGQVVIRKQGSNVEKLVIR